MDKYFIENVIEQVREIPITTIAEERIRLIGNGVDKKGLCPFHNDKHIGSLSISDRKGIFKCFSCGTGGDGIKFIMLLDGMNYVESAMKIAYRRGIINLSEYDDFLNRKFSDKKSRNIEKKYVEMDKDRTKTEIAPIEILNNVYTAFINEASLSENHKKYLIEQRGFNEEDIVKGKYFTFPSNRESFIKSFIERLKSDYGYCQDVLKNVPGFYREKSSDSWKFCYSKGLGIPIKGANTFIAGIQIRKDKPSQNKSRYIWFSSALAENNEKTWDLFDCRTSSGSPIDVVYPKKIKYTSIFITEGRFKAKKIAETYNAIAISVQGITTWANIIEQIKQIKAIYPALKFENIYIAFDADMAYNVQVFKQAMEMGNRLKKEFEGIEISYNMWATEFGKGIDDVIESGNTDKIDVMKKERFDTLYTNMIKTLKEKEGKIDDIKKEVIKAYFDSLILSRFKKYKM